MDPRAINFNVLRRHDPQISSILDSTSYAVIYRYFHGAWSKTGFEGTLFVFQRHAPPLYGIFVLNRQGLDNLSEGLFAGWDVDLDEGLIIWRSAGATGEADDDVIYGIWVYEEKDRSRIATRMQELIDSASAQQDQPPQPPTQPASSPPPVSLSHPVPRVPIITAGQTISLDQLFGVASVCSDPPPHTSTLPHPATSLADPDEQPDGGLPSKVMSPDPSELPKGMQLLDSLFQKAAIKSQTSHPSSSNSEPAHPPTSIHQLINQAPSSHPKPSSQSTTTSPKARSNKPRRERRHGSRDDHSNLQPIHPDPSAHPHQRAIHQSSRPDHRLTINHSNSHTSRRSSGASSSHSRLDKVTTPLDPPNQPQPHLHTQAPAAHLHSSNPASLVTAPVPIENANAEARHNILSLLGHPAAIQPDPIDSTATDVPNPVVLASPPTNGVGRGGTDWQAATSETHASHHQHLYSPQQHPSINYHPYRHPGSQAASKEPSPRQANLQQPFIQHPLPIPSYGNQTDLTPPRAGQVRSTNHSPNGPRPQIDSRQRSKLPGGQQPSDQAPVSSSGQPGFTNSTWPLDKLPSRALSPLNPARQSPSHRGGGGAGGAGYYQPSSNRKSIIISAQQPSLPSHIQQQQPRISEHSPPQVNDSSRPSRSHSYAGSHENNPPGGANLIHHDVRISSLNAKVAAESLDSLLADQPLGQPPPSNDSANVDDNPMDKISFANSILDLINNNGAFVDSLYARYLARYAEKYL